MSSLKIYHDRVRSLLNSLETARFSLSGQTQDNIEKIRNYHTDELDTHKRTFRNYFLWYIFFVAFPFIFSAIYSVLSWDFYGLFPTDWDEPARRVASGYEGVILLIYLLVYYNKKYN
jgi:hypothetical protein